MPQVFVLGIDPGLASFGLAIVALTPTEEIVHELLVKTTEPSSRKLNVLAADDTFSRARKLAELFEGHVNRMGESLHAICAESMSWPRSSTNATKTAISWGILASVAVRTKLPLVMATPMEIKTAVCNSKTASKGEVQKALFKRYPDAAALKTFKKFVGKTKQEHGFDALGSVVACLDSEVIRLARRFSS